MSIKAAGLVRFQIQELFLIKTELALSMEDLSAGVDNWLLARLNNQIAGPTTNIIIINYETKGQLNDTFYYLGQGAL